MLEARGLRCGYGKLEIVHGIDFSVEPGEFACVLGPNGCGKTTTMKAILGLISVMGGGAFVDGHDVAAMSEAERARHLAYIPQAHTPPFPFTVADVVILGRTPYVNKLARVPEADKRIALECMERMGVAGFAERPYTHLSGGQQQLVLIARALAQRPSYLVMDEPTASLDFGNQQLVLRQMRNLADMGVGVLMVTHDPDHALFCASRVVVMEAGSVIADGAPCEVLDEACLQRIYGDGVRLTEADVDGERVRVCVPAPHGR